MLIRWSVRAPRGHWAALDPPLGQRSPPWNRLPKPDWAGTCVKPWKPVRVSKEWEDVGSRPHLPRNRTESPSSQDYRLPFSCAILLEPSPLASLRAACHDPAALRSPRIAAARLLSATVSKAA